MKKSEIESIEAFCQQRDISPKVLLDVYEQSLTRLNEALPLLFQSEGVQLIAIERQRQIEFEGWNAEHDDLYINGELAKAAAAYASPVNIFVSGNSASGIFLTIKRTFLWPFEIGWFKPSPDNRIRELEKAGGLIASEIDRLLRSTNK